MALASLWAQARLRPNVGLPPRLDSERTAKRLIKRLEAMGLAVTLTECPKTQPAPQALEAPKQPIPLAV